MNSIWLHKCVTLVVSTKSLLLLCSTKQEKTTWARHGTFFTTITTQNTGIKWKSDFRMYTIKHVDRAWYMNVRPPKRLAQLCKFIRNFNVFNNMKITWYYSVYMHTWGEKIRLFDEAEHDESVSHSHIQSLSKLYTGVCLREGKRGTCLSPSF